MDNGFVALKFRSRKDVGTQASVPPSDPLAWSALLFGNHLSLRRTLEVLALCQEAGQGHEVTAALRIMREQLKARSDPSVAGTNALGLVVGLGLLETFSHMPKYPGVAIYLVPLLLCVFFGLVMFSLHFRRRGIEGRYKIERQAIEERAVWIIAQYGLAKDLPRRLYEQDVQDLERLAHHHPQISPIATRWRNELSARLAG